jgi:hypothetical protein
MDSDGTTWWTTYNIGKPYEMVLNKQTFTDFTVSQNRVYPVLSTGTNLLTISYTVNWWDGNEAIIPNDLPIGNYKVIIANGVKAIPLDDYISLYLTDNRGLITTSGTQLLGRLGDPILWSTRYWGDNLYFYKDDPILSPIQEVWDEDIEYTI